MNDDTVRASASISTSTSTLDPPENIPAIDPHLSPLGTSRLMRNV